MVESFSFLKAKFKTIIDNVNKNIQGGKAPQAKGGECLFVCLK
jgi:hypothetical protein